MGPPDRFELTRLRVSPATLKGYNRDLQLFLEWIPENRLFLKAWKDLDLLVAEYAVHVYNTNGGRRRQAVQNAKAALELYFPEALGTFLITNRSLEGWAKACPIQQRPVCPRMVAYGLAHDILRQGKPDIAVAVLLAFDCYLRAGDLKNIQIQHVRLQSPRKDKPPSETESPYCGALFLPQTKRGLNQSVLIRPFFLGVLLERLIARRLAQCESDPTAPLFNFPIRSLNYALQRAASNTNSTSLEITTHALRYGGATQDAADRALPYVEIKARGRWHNDKSFQRYLQPGLLYAQIHKIPPDVRDGFMRLEDDPGQYFNVPPPGLP
jgi:integrase